MTGWDKIQDPTWQKEYLKRGKFFNKKKKKRSKAVTKLAQSMRVHLTKSEETLHEILKSNKIRHTMQRVLRCINKYNFIADCYIPSQKLVIEVDGGYHETWWQRQRDMWRTGTIILKDPEIKVIRLTNQELSDLTPAEVTALLRAHFDRFVAVG